MAASQLNKLKSSTKNATEEILRLSSKRIAHNLLLTDRHVACPSKAFANKSLANVKFSKTQLSLIMPSRGFLSRHPQPLLKLGLPLMNYIPKSLAKGVLIPLELTATASAADTGIH